MKIIIQKAKRRKTEHGYYFNEIPETIVVKHCFQPGESLYIGKIPFGRYYSDCEIKTNDCIPNNALRYSKNKELCHLIKEE